MFVEYLRKLITNKYILFFYGYSLLLLTDVGKRIYFVEHYHKIITCLGYFFICLVAIINYKFFLNKINKKLIIPLFFIILLACVSTFFYTKFYDY